MSRQVIFEPEAWLELQDAAAWHDAQRPGLGDQFAAEIDETLLRILRNPGQFPLVGSTVRRARVRVFESYSVVFSVEPDFLGVISVFLGARDPAELRRRLK